VRSIEQEGTGLSQLGGGKRWSRRDDSEQNEKPLLHKGFCIANDQELTINY